MRYAFAGDREISCIILEFLVKEGFYPSALMVNDREKGSHTEDLIKISDLDNDMVFCGKSFKDPDNIKSLKMLNLDYIFGIHFPFIVPKEVLDIPEIGFLNLHPAYLPYNKGWHTPSWAILEGTPYGATLHFMDEALDAGDIVHQKKMEVSQAETADSLYQKVLNLEFQVFKEAFPDILNLRPGRTPQREGGTSHAKKDLQSMREIDLNEKIEPLELIDRLRALSTNQTSETAFFRIGNKKIGVKIQLFEI